MRLIVASMLLAGGMLAWPMSTVAVRAEPETCPPVCDEIPDTAWIRPQAIPLSSTYRWPSPVAAAVPVTGKTPRFRFEEICATPTFAQDARDSAVAARAVLTNPQGQWQLQAQVLHWRGDTARGGANADWVFDVAAAALRGCQLGAPARSPLVTADGAGRLAVVISGPTIMHTYLVAHPQSSTVSELTLWSSAPPQVPWPAVSDEQVLDAMTRPLCAAYLGSCE